MRKEVKYKIISIISILAVVGIWEILTAVLKIIPSYTVPTPLSVLVAFVYKLHGSNPDGSTLIQNLLASLEVAVMGYVVGALVGIPLGIGMAWYKPIEVVTKPLFDLIRPIPPVAWIPILILWLGIGQSARVTIIFISAFIPCVINSYAGIRQTNSVHMWVAQTFGASNFEVLTNIAIPSALPMIFTGLKISLGSSWSSLVAAEMLAAARGLGYMIEIASGVARPDIIVVGMLTIGGLGALLALLLEVLERQFIKGWG